MKKTAVNSFKTTPIRKTELETLAKENGSALGPYIEKKIEAVTNVYESDLIHKLFQLYKGRKLSFLNLNGKKEFIEINAITDIHNCLLKILDERNYILKKLNEEGRVLADFEEKDNKEETTIEGMARIVRSLITDFIQISILNIYTKQPSFRS